jgi:hypothetical protein
MILTQLRTSKFQALREDTPQPTHLPPALFLSGNSKTGFSINVAIAHTCRPTRDCSRYCYGLQGRVRMLASLTRQAENYVRFEYLETAHEEVVRHEAEVIAHEVRARQDFLRFFGVGDLQEGSVRFINVLAAAAPDLALWVSSRNLQLVHSLDARPNVHVMISLDASTPSALMAQARRFVDGRDTALLAWVQQHPDESIPSEVGVVFAEHHAAKRARWTSERADPRTCPATVADGPGHEEACARCRYCFDKSVRGGRWGSALGPRS